ncbi:MAG: Xaa-Pro peptidase family protein [Pseudomonadota bacterium]
MPPPFSRDEYADRLTRMRHSLVERGLEALVIGDPANINWLTGYDAWSFYTPQIMVVGQELAPTWIGREMDAGAAAFTTYLPEAQVVPFPEDLVQKPGVHPAQFMADWMRGAGLDGKTIGYESDVYFLTSAAVGHLQAGLPNARWVDGDLLVNSARVVKSRAEIEMMGQAAAIAGLAMQTAYDGVRPGVRQCDLMAEVVAAQIRGTPEFGGDQTALHPLVLAGEAASTAHPLWTDAPFEAEQTIAFELGGCRKRYNAGLARTVHLGTPPQELTDTAKAVEEGMVAVLDSLKAGVTTASVHGAWQGVLDRYGLEKKSRIGYSIGIGYAPDWGEHTLSFRPGETDLVPKDAVVHIILGMWMAGWGMELSETIHVRAKDAVCLTQFPRAVEVIGL